MRTKRWLVALVIAALLLGYPYVRDNRLKLQTGLVTLIVAAIAVWGITRVTRSSMGGYIVATILVLVVVANQLGGFWGATPASGDLVRMAALGDSYSSGEGARASGEDYDAAIEFGTSNVLRDDPRCHRSHSAYPRRIAEALGRTELLFVACSGALIADATTKGQLPGMVPQIDQLKRFASEGAVDVVTLTLGGNDLGFAKILYDCGLADCVTGDPSGDVATVAALDPSGGSFATNPILLGLVDALTRVRQTVGPKVPVVILGYPNIMPAAACVTPLMAVYSTPELNLIRRGWAAGNRLVREAAIRSGAFFVDMQNAFARHEICGPSPFAHGPTVPTITEALARSSPVAASSFHPTPAGHGCMAEVLWQQYRTLLTLEPPPIGTALTDQPEVGSAQPCR